jgi:hypothetical protein
MKGIHPKRLKTKSLKIQKSKRWQGPKVRWQVNHGELTGNTMAGLKRICKLYGSIQINDVLWLWDYARDEPRLATEMSKEDIAASERAKWGAVKKETKKPSKDW